MVSRNESTRAALPETDEDEMDAQAGTTTDGAPRGTDDRSQAGDGGGQAGNSPSPASDDQRQATGDHSQAGGNQNQAGTADAARGPQSILTCAECGRKNKIRPSERGTPHCGSCGKPLPWLVEAGDTTFPFEARASVAVLVDLWAPWCGPCRVVGPMLEALSKEYAGRLKVVKVNVDENPMLARQFGASSIPTLVVIKNDRIVDRIVGALPPNDLKMRLFPYLMRT